MPFGENAPSKPPQRTQIRPQVRSRDANAWVVRADGGWHRLRCRISSTPLGGVFVTARGHFRPEMESHLPRRRRLYGVLNSETAIWENPDTTYLLKGGCAFCLAKRTYSDTELPGVL